jgi:hypothetical protein
MPVELIFDQPWPSRRCSDGVYGVEGIDGHRVFHFAPGGSAF